MSERYSRIFNLTENLYTKGIPVIIKAGALLKDNEYGNILAQVKYRNLENKSIKLLKVKIKALDSMGRELGSETEFSYLDLSAKRDEDFGAKTAIPLPTNQARSFSVSITEVGFYDNTLWIPCDDMPPQEQLPTQTKLTEALKNSDQLRHYKHIFGEQCNFLPKRVKDLWLCACGTVNKYSDERCHSCNSKIKDLESADLEEIKVSGIYYAARSLMSNDNVSSLESARKKLTEIEDFKDSSELIKSIDERIRKLNADKNKRIKLIKLVSTIAAAVACVAIVFVILLNNLIIPNSNYKAALALMDEGRYHQAISKFEELEGYKDSEIKIAECNEAINEAVLENKYNAAITLMDEGYYAAAISSFEAIGNYRDSEGKITECEAAIVEEEYNDAIALMNEKSYDEALSIFLSLDGYKDSAKKIEECMPFCGLEFKFDETTQTYTVSKYTGTLDSISIPAMYNKLPVTKIGSWAFYNCINLSSVTLSKGVAEIESYAFYGCSNLSSITIPSSVIEIGSNAFYGCSSLQSVNIPSSVIEIGSNAFYGCSSLQSVNIPSSVTIIGNSAFGGCKELSSVTIPSGVTEINASTFNGCTNLSSLTVPNSVTSIGNSAFSGCTSLSSIALSNSVTEIGSYAFYDCTNLSSITIPSSVTKIGSFAFEGCTSLSDITIPRSVTEIGSYAFYDCTKLSTVYFKNPYGWSYGWMDLTFETLNLSNPSTNAEYLRDTYFQYTWSRS